MKIGIIIYAVITCHGAFEYRSSDPNVLFPMQYAVHDTSSPVVMMSPALLPFAEGLLFNSSAGRPYSEKVLSTGGSAIQYGGEGYGLQLSWHMFGADFYREQTFSLKAGYSIFPFLHAGVSENLYILKAAVDDMNIAEKTTGTDFALIITPYQWINAGFTQSGVTSLFSKKNSDLLYPERTAGVLLKPCRGFSLSWNITDTAVERVNTFTASVNPASFFSLSGGYCRENSSFAASVGILAKKFFVTYGLKYHPYLGYTHSIGLTYALDTGIKQLDYGDIPFRSSGKKINIRTAAIEDLKQIRGLSDLSAERIILYRRKIGPVNEKALMQIGLTGEEIDILESNVYGLERVHRNKDGERDFKKFKKRPPRNERIKNRFRKLISAGISAYTAITYSELSESGNSEDFTIRLMNDNSLNDAQKKLIEKICLK